MRVMDESDMTDLRLEILELTKKYAELKLDPKPFVTGVDPVPVS